MKRIIEVSSCDDCPYHCVPLNVHHFCNFFFLQWEGIPRKLLTERKEVTIHGEATYITTLIRSFPEWCPLKESV